MALSGCVVDRVGSNRNAVRGLFGSLGGLRAASLARSESLGQGGGVCLGQGLASADGLVSDRADGGCCVNFLGLGSGSRNSVSRLHTATLAASNDKSARGGVCECNALFDSGDGAQRGRGVYGLSASDVGSRDPGGRGLSRLGATSLAAGDGQSRGQGSCLCVGLASGNSGVGRRADGSGDIGDKGRGSVVLNRGRSNRRGLSPTSRLSPRRRLVPRDQGRGLGNRRRGSVGPCLVPVAGRCKTNKACKDGERLHSFTDVQVDID
jgi:hypothetical protein